MENFDNLEDLLIRIQREVTSKENEACDKIQNIKIESFVKLKPFLDARSEYLKSLPEKERVNFWKTVFENCKIFKNSEETDEKTNLDFISDFNCYYSQDKTKLIVEFCLTENKYLENDFIRSELNLKSRKCKTTELQLKEEGTLPENLFFDFFVMKLNEYEVFECFNEIYLNAGYYFLLI